VNDPTFDAELDRVLIGGREKRAVVVVPYDTAWPERYARERVKIIDALGQSLRNVHHVGSTAVEGLAAKPIIDILLVVSQPEVEETYTPALEQAGYVLRVREPGHRMFRTPEKDVHIHVWADPSEDARHLRFRDWLRHSPEDRAAYEALKVRLAAQDWEDVNYYARAKSDLIGDIMERTRAWASTDGGSGPP
jgi:GrpB-like predicted nucleotidyltransferase (UPF0157 family)